jgi:hypothetical protein
VPSAVPAKPAVPVKVYATDPSAQRVPAESGMYYFQRSNPARLDLKILLGMKQGAGLGKVLLKKGKTLAYVAGAGAKLVISTDTPILYMRLPQGKTIEEYVLVALESRSDRRELDTGPGPKQELNASAIRAYDNVEVGPGLFRITPAPLKPGEYLFFQIGSAEPEKGNQGRGYEFAISAPPARP